MRRTEFVIPDARPITVLDKWTANRRVGEIAPVRGALAAIQRLRSATAILSSEHHCGNWSGTQEGEGFEYHLLVLAMTTFLMIRVGRT